MDNSYLDIDDHIGELFRYLTALLFEFVVGGDPFGGAGFGDGVGYTVRSWRLVRRHHADSDSVHCLL